MKMQVQTISGWGLTARLSDDGKSITVFDEQPGGRVEIVTVPATVGKAKFFHTANHRAGANSTSMMAGLIETLVSLPEMEKYL